MIQDMFPANLIIPDAMVWSDHGGGELLKRDCPIRRHLRVLMEVDGEEEEEEEGAYVYPITCAELLNGNLIVLMEGKIGTLWTPGYVDN